MVRKCIAELRCFNKNALEHTQTHLIDALLFLLQQSLLDLNQSSQFFDLCFLLFGRRRRLRQRSQDTSRRGRRRRFVGGTGPLDVDARRSSFRDRSRLYFIVYVILGHGWPIFPDEKLMGRDYIGRGGSVGCSRPAFAFTERIDDCTVASGGHRDRGVGRKLAP